MFYSALVVKWTIDLVFIVNRPLQDLQEERLAGRGFLDQIVNIRRMRILLCWTFSLECSSCLYKKNSTLSLPAFRRQLKRFYCSQY